MSADQFVRLQALNPAQSFLVQAPAGSGKTSLLIQRFLALLAQVEWPEQILAMTFTRKAAGEMRERIIHSLRQAQGEAPAHAHQQQTWQLARAALHRDAEKGWGLLDNPGRLCLLTIDGFCRQITRNMPLLSGLGGEPSIADDPDSLYQQAATASLDSAAGDASMHTRLYTLLRHADARRFDLESIIASMLGRRDQWQHVVVHSTHDIDSLRQRMQHDMQQQIDQVLSGLQQAFSPPLLTQIETLADFSRQQLQQAGKDCPWSGLEHTRRDSQHYWAELAAFLLTQEGDWRKRLDIHQGFPPKSPQKQTIAALIQGLADDAALAESLHACRQLPTATLTDATWDTLAAMLHILRLALAQLRLAFQQARQCDYTEIALAAVRALGNADAPSEGLLALDQRIQHILVDEFQDTSILQFSLLRLLCAGWQRGDGRTLFAVGDPMQSIYRFRKAELGLFLQAWEQARIGEVPVQCLRLSANFRSEPGLVHWCNQAFAHIFPPRHDLLRGAAAFVDSLAQRGNSHSDHIILHHWDSSQPEDEARVMVEEIRQSLGEQHGKIAILVAQSRHASPIMAALRHADIAYRSEGLDPLLGRPVIGDLLSLTRVLLHPGDRLHWLALLHSPMIGLGLDDLLALTEADALNAEQDRRPAALIEQLLQTQASSLSADGQTRIQRFWPLWQQAQAQLAREAISRITRSLWISLGGPVCSDPRGWQDAEHFFSLLETLENRQSLRIDTLMRALDKLRAQANHDTQVRVEIMTMHKAKGLQFDTVILPQLSRRSGQDDRPLLLLEESLDGAVLMAPKPARGSEHADDRFYAWLNRREKARLSEERKRLLYVAITRAERKLILSGVVNKDLPQGELFSLLWRADLPMRRVPHDDVSTTNLAPPALQRLCADWLLAKPTD